MKKLQTEARRLAVKTKDLESRSQVWSTLPYICVIGRTDLTLTYLPPEHDLST